MGQWLTKTARYIFFQKYTSKVYLLLCWYQKYTFKVPKYTFCCVDQMLQRFLPKYVFCCVDTKSILSKSRRWPLILPTLGLPTGRQSWGRQFWVHQSSGLPTLIMKTYFDMFWTIHGKYNRLSPWIVEWLTRRAEQGLSTISRLGIDATFKVFFIIFSCEIFCDFRWPPAILHSYS